jgi:hypothetical protein
MEDSTKLGQKLKLRYSKNAEGLTNFAGGEDWQIFFVF